MRKTSLILLGGIIFFISCSSSKSVGSSSTEVKNETTADAVKKDAPKLKPSTDNKQTELRYDR